jgi:hypothetical protein
MKTSELKQIIREEIRKVLAEAYVPDNILKFAKHKGVDALVKKVANWAEKSGSSIKGGTAIGKNYSTLLLDLTRQGGEIRINTDTDEVTLNGKTVKDARSFKNALQEAYYSTPVDPEVAARNANYLNPVVDKTTVTAMMKELKKLTPKIIKVKKNDQDFARFSMPGIDGEVRVAVSIETEPNEEPEVTTPDIHPRGKSAVLFSNADMDARVFSLSVSQRYDSEFYVLSVMLFR